MTCPKEPVSPVTVAPERIVVNVPETPVILETLTVSPLTIDPLKRVVNTPVAPVIVVVLTSVPVMVLPVNTPVVLIVEAN